jgi:hypothetical protein
VSRQSEHFEGGDLDSGRWVPYYLPHWSSRSSSRATYAVSGSVLRLTIPTSQALWCPDRHSPALRTSTIASGLYAGPVGSTVGQQPFVGGLTVTEEQEVFRGWLVGHGRFSVTARADVSERSMVSVWLTGFEDRPDRCGEVCVFEVFGDTVSGGDVGVGAGIHEFRDPALGEDFTVTRTALDLSEWHRFEVEMRPDGCSWRVDGRMLRESAQCPTYPLQVFVGVFDFPDRDPDRRLAGHEPVLEVDEITVVPSHG